MPISQTEGYFENPWYRFLEEPKFFLLAWKWNLEQKAFFSVKTKTNPNFAVKLAGSSNHSFLLSIWWRHFSNICTLNTWTKWIIELNWLCKHIKNVRSSQPAIHILNWVKHSVPQRVSLKDANKSADSTRFVHI